MRLCRRPSPNRWRSEKSSRGQSFPSNFIGGFRARELAENSFHGGIESRVVATRLRTPLEPLGGRSHPDATATSGERREKSENEEQRAESDSELRRVVTDFDSDVSGQAGELDGPEAFGKLEGIAGFENDLDAGVTTRDLREFVDRQLEHVSVGSVVQPEVTFINVERHGRLGGFGVVRRQRPRVEFDGGRVEEPLHADLLGETVGDLDDTDGGEVRVLTDEWDGLAEHDVPRRVANSDDGCETVAQQIDL